VSSVIGGPALRNSLPAEVALTFGLALAGLLALEACERAEGGGLGGGLREES